MEQYNEGKLSNGLAILILIGIMALCIVSYIFIDNRIDNQKKIDKVEMVDTSAVHIRKCGL